jgi:hypothetical protein
MFDYLWELIQGSPSKTRGHTKNKTIPYNPQPNPNGNTQKPNTITYRSCSKSFIISAIGSCQWSCQKVEECPNSTKHKFLKWNRKETFMRLLKPVTSDSTVLMWTVLLKQKHNCIIKHPGISYMMCWSCSNVSTKYCTCHLHHEYTTKGMGVVINVLQRKLQLRLVEL